MKFPVWIAITQFFILATFLLSVVIFAIDRFAIEYPVSYDILQNTLSRGQDDSNYFRLVGLRTAGLYYCNPQSETTEDGQTGQCTSTTTFVAYIDSKIQSYQDTYYDKGDLANLVQCFQTYRGGSIATLSFIVLFMVLQGCMIIYYGLLRVHYLACSRLRLILAMVVTISTFALHVAAFALYYSVLPSGTFVIYPRVLPNKNWDYQTLELDGVFVAGITLNYYIAVLILSFFSCVSSGAVLRKFMKVERLQMRSTGEGEEDDRNALLLREWTTTKTQSRERRGSYFSL